MYLKSIEIQGFKSFANKITFEFHNGITGIVGPNGSGKSNVSDAVRWVLGEQSAKQLRGGSMQDVIFAGTELRKPQGFAYVAITLENSDRALAIDYDEVKVSRRLYRSGESEYQINGSPCRLRDINEMFMDTGIGQDGYSIIGQGQVEQILSGKADDRRELFDEAAGITKFRKRKALAEKKLENERANMLRIGDILSELERQVGPLKKQSEAAQEYLRLREEQKRYDLNLFLLESDSCRSELADLENKEEILQGDADEAEARQAELRTQYEDLEKAIGELENGIQALRNQISEATAESGSLAGQINVYREQINTERANAEHIETRLKAIDADREVRETELSIQQESGKETDAETKKAKKEAEEAEWKLVSADEEIMVLDQKIQDLKNAVIDAINERGEIAARGQRFETLLEQIQVRTSESTQRLLKLQSEADALDKEIEAENRKRQDAREKEADLKRRRADAEERLSQAADEVSRLVQSLQKAQQQYQAETVRLESLRNLAERYDGYGNSIRRVMETQDRIRGIHGVVADLITVDRQYETAIETALGGRIQNIVTDSEETAKRLIEHLKRNRYGRATFLPLTSAGNAKRWEPGPVMQEDGVIGIAADLVHTEPRYEGLIRSLLGRDIVVRDIDRAIAIERKYHYSFRIVTPEGELLNPGGSMSGGAYKNSSNLLGRKREIEELEASVEKILKQADRTQAELDQANTVHEEVKAEIESLRGEEQTLLLEKNTEEMALARLTEKREELEDSLNDIASERVQLTQQTDEINDSRRSLNTDIAGIEDRRAAMEQEIASKNVQLEEERRRREDLAGAQQEAQLAYSAAFQRNGFIAENIRRLKEELKKLTEEREALEGGTEDTKNRIGEKEAAIREDEARIEALKEKLSGLNEKLEKAGSERTARAEEQKKYFEKRDEIAERRSALDKDLFRVRAQMEKISDRLSARVNYILSEYNLTEEGAKQYRSEEKLSAAQMKKEIDARKSAIRALGSVNVNAIEDYKQVSARYTQVKTQHDDLKKAEESLVQIIVQLDEGMRRQFNEQFAKIRTEFNKVFRELFGGGRGELRLEEGVDVLEAGITIIAEPPGKKLQNMMQLSGGEKALTAISLLFAIQNLKPSPFALLDEIEAALDDSNVERFTEYLKKLTKNTQFIVITHRRGTMVGADRLYGITMQEKGISTLVSVKLIEDSLDK